MSFTQARRQGIKLYIGLLGKSGGGKTYSALMLGRGIVGPDGKLGLADSENGRGSLFCDLIPNGYLTMDIKPPFTPETYIEVLEKGEAAGLDCLVIDSTTHEWTGEGGYLDMKNEVLDRMAGDDWKKREACGMAASAKVKPRHNKFVARLARCNMHVILCFRAKDGIRMEKEGGRTKIVKDDEPVAIQESGLIYETIIAGEVYAKEINGKQIGGFFRCTKHTHAEILDLLPGENDQLGIPFGALWARWANAATLSGPQKPAASSSEKERVALKKRIWDRAKPYYKTLEELEAWLRGGKLLLVDECLTDATNEQLAAICTAVEEALEAKW